jgi:hypothetical protein
MPNVTIEKLTVIAVTYLNIAGRERAYKQARCLCKACINSLDILRPALLLKPLTWLILWCTTA